MQLKCHKDDKSDIILASWFHTYEFEKIKFNWFSYNYALNLYDCVRENKKLKSWASGMGGDLQVAHFCAYFAKRMKKSVEDKLAGFTDATLGDEEYISDYCHTNTGRQNAEIIKVAGVAWERLVSNCVTCTTRCISERFEHCDIFDRIERGGSIS
ncbi:MAG: hypothetical protein LBU70_02675 [Chitinispirillales bacterium]|jgi:hypothetical protein|nr:hypothetical protein [Chitinispirillales bacterium]